MIILIGESGSGKSTILELLCERGYKKAINYTTRLPRGEEIGKNTDMIFISKGEFESLWEENKLLQRAEFNNEYYGLSIDSLSDDVVCISIVDSIKDIKDKIREIKSKVKTKVFYIYVPHEERIKRMRKRGDSEETIQTKLMIDEEKFKRAREVCDYVIENIDLDRAINEIERLNKE